METKMSENVSPVSEEFVEVEESIELDEEIAMTRPPDPITLPVVQTQATPAADQPLEQLGRLCQDLTEVKPIEPPPRPEPAPKVYQRPSRGFD